jgi:signal transduction histidine kinase
MEALLELIGAIVVFIFEVTVHALVFVYLLFRAAYSATYRQKLSEHWNTSNWRRVSILLGIGLYSAALIFALMVWIPILTSSDQRQETPRSDEAIKIEFTSEEIKKLKETKEIDELVDTAGEFIKRKIEERRQAEQVGAPNPLPAE